MDYLSLEKTTQHSKKDIKVDLRIVSTKAVDHPMDIGERTILIVHQSQSVEAMYFFQDKKEKLSTEAYEFGRIIHWPESVPPIIQASFLLHTVSTVFSAVPIWNTIFPPTGKQVLSIPAYGCLENEWHDGWMTHFSKTGKVLSLIPPGTQSRLYVPLISPKVSGLTWSRALEELPPLDDLRRQCIVDCLQSGVKIEDLKRIKIFEFGLHECACLLLLRQAFPKGGFEIQNVLNKKEWPSRFKNFLDSIGANWKTGEEGILLEHFFACITKTDVMNLVPLLNQKTRILEGC